MYKATYIHVNVCACMCVFRWFSLIPSNVRSYINKRKKKKKKKKHYARIDAYWTIIQEKNSNTQSISNLTHLALSPSTFSFFPPPLSLYLHCGSVVRMSCPLGREITNTQEMNKHLLWYGIELIKTHFFLDLFFFSFHFQCVFRWLSTNSKQYIENSHIIGKLNGKNNWKQKQTSNIKVLDEKSIENKCEINRITLFLCGNRDAHIHA